MKRAGIGIAAVIAAVLVFMVIRTFMASAPGTTATAAPPIPVDKQLVANHLAQAVRFQTVSYGDGVKEKEKAMALEAMRDWMEMTYPNFHSAAGPEEFGGSLLFTWHGLDPNLPPVLLMAHLDVVPIVPGTEKDWTHGAFSGDIADGFVWGRGTIDDKGEVVALLDAAEKLAAGGFQPQRTILFAFGEDEEVGGSKGNGRIAKAIQARGMHFAWVLDEGSPVTNEPYPGVRKPLALIATGEKGFLSLELTAHGTGGHAARPSRDLALPRLSTAILNVVNHPFVSDLDDIQRTKLQTLTPMVPFGDRFLLANLWLTKPLVMRTLEAEPSTAATLHTTISPTILEAGIKENVIPPTARAVINFRLHQRDTIRGVTDHVKEAIGDAKVDIAEREETVSEGSKIVPENSPAYTYVGNAIRETFGVPIAPELMTGATDSRHYLPLADAVLRFRPFHADPDDLIRVHGTNERVAIDDLASAVDFYTRLMTGLK
jgi:carboxypeptidase PM20D1